MKNTLTLLTMLLSFSAAFSQKIEAENYSAMLGVVKEPTQDSGAGQELGYIDAGDWADYVINPSAAGVYTVNFRVAGISASQINVLSGATVLATVTTPVTGAWQTWTTVSATLKLSAGQQTIRLSFVKNGINLNWFELVPPASSVVLPSISLTDLKSQIDSLTSTINAIKAQLNASVIYFDSSYVGGKGTPVAPYYFLIPATK